MAEDDEDPFVIDYDPPICGDITAAKVNEAVSDNPALAAKIEAAMMVSTAARDKEGRRIFYRVSPPVALAIIQVLEAQNPIAAAMEFCGNRQLPPIEKCP